MLKAKELRLGNYVKRITLSPDSNDIREEDVLVVNSATIRILENNEVNDNYGGMLSNYQGYSVYVQPIPLTEESLLKFGFKPLDNKNWYLGKIKVWLGATGIYHQFTTPDDIDDVLLKYVHQLQNLYFALRGEELTIEKHEIHS
jgi:hypothetical protein